MMGWYREVKETKLKYMAYTVQQIHYPPGNHHTRHFKKCPISRSQAHMLTSGTDDPSL